MKTSWAVLALLCAVSATSFARSAADIVSRMPEETLAVLATENAGGAFRRFVAALEKAPLPIPDEVRVRLLGAKDMAHLFAGPAVLGGDLRGWGGVVKLAAPEELFRALLLQLPQARPEDEAAPKAISFPIPNGPRVFAAFRPGEMFFADAAERLARLMNEGAGDESELADFYVRRELAKRAAGGVVLMVDSRVARAPADQLRRLRQAEAGLPERRMLLRAAASLAEGFSGPMAVLWSWSKHASALELAATVEGRGTAWELLAAPPSGERLAAISASAADLVVSGDFGDAASAMRAIEPLAGAMNPGIGEMGFAETLAAYNQMLGIDLERDLLGALDGSWSAAFEMQREGPAPLRVEAGVRDADSLKNSLRAVASLRDAPWNDGDVVRTTVLGGPLHAIRFAQGRLRADYSGEAPDEEAERAGWVDDPAFAPALKSAVPPALAALVSVQPFVALVPAAERAEVERAFQGLQEALFTARARNGLLSLRLDAKPGVEPLVAGMAALALARRDQAGEANLRRIGAALRTYAARHDGALPQRLNALAPNYVPHMALRCPATGPFIYFGEGMNANAPRAHEAIVAATARPGTDGRRRVLFLDRRVLALPNDEYARRIEEQGRIGFATARARGEPSVKAQDPHEQGVSWLGYAWGALKSGPQGEREFRGILGEAEPVPTCFAFTPDTVWMGTRRGLFQWHRAHRFWSRVAVGGELFDAPVAELLVDGDKLRVVVEINGRLKTTTFDLDGRRWL